MLGTNVQKMREANVRLVLNHIRRFASTSRSQIARMTSLSASTISGIVDRLIALDFVKESPVVSHRSGRRPIKLYLNDQEHYSVGIEIETGHLLGIVINLLGQVIKEQRVPISPFMGYSLILDKLAGLYHELVSDMSAKMITGLGIASPGYVDGALGQVVYSSNQNWRNVPVLDIVSPQVDVPVFIQSNITAVALGELWYGAGEGKRDIICVRVGSGIGAGLVLDGEIYHGPQHRAGHFGHMVIERGGNPCRCGDSGCLEAYVSTTRLIDRATEALGTGAFTHLVFPSEKRLDKLDAIIEAGLRGDRFILNVFAEMGELLGIGISNLINILNPELIILAGGMARAEELILEPVRRTVRLHAFPPIPEITTSALGPYTVAIGAATQAVEAAFRNPIPEQTPA